MDRELVKNENIQEDDEFEMLPMNPMWYNPMLMNMRDNMMGMMPIDHEYMSMMSMMPMMPIMDMEKMQMMNMEFERQDNINDEEFYNNNMNYDENERENFMDYDEMVDFNGMEMDYGNEFRNEKNNFNDNYDDKMFFDKNYKPGNLSKVDFIVRKIERNNPGILNTMTSYGMPYPVAKRLIRRIVALTLNYC